MFSFEAMILASVAGLFILIVVGLIAAVSILRQRRHLRLYRAEMQRRSLDLSVALSQLVPEGNADTVVGQPRSVRAQIQPVAAYVHVVQFSPDRLNQNPTNVQRLIDYLQAEMERMNQAS